MDGFDVFCRNLFIFYGVDNEIIVRELVKNYIESQIISEFIVQKLSVFCEYQMVLRVKILIVTVYLVF